MAVSSGVYCRGQHTFVLQDDDMVNRSKNEKEKTKEEMVSLLN